MHSAMTSKQAAWGLSEDCSPKLSAATSSSFAECVEGSGELPCLPLPLNEVEVSLDIFDAPIVVENNPRTAAANMISKPYESSTAPVVGISYLNNDAGMALNSGLNSMAPFIGGTPKIGPILSVLDQPQLWLPAGSRISARSDSWAAPPTERFRSSVANNHQNMVWKHHISTDHSCGDHSKELWPSVDTQRFNAPPRSTANAPTVESRPPGMSMNTSLQDSDSPPKSKHQSVSQTETPWTRLSRRFLE